ncbi:glycosyltransferase family 4 protein (plasmid) [Enterococcus faecium]|uniref:glycosyltransferase family 4 protein n=1 Tax=Enterococcus faecium TaxID=1352 RepID=UPI0038D3CF59
MILVVSNMYPSPQAPNYGVFVRNFCEKLQETHEIKIISLTKKNNKLTKLMGYLIFYLNIFFHFVFRRYELVYVHYAGYNSPPLLLGRLFNKKTKLIVNVHGSDVTPEKNLERKTNFLTKYLVRLADLVVVPSVYFEKIVKKKYGDVPTFISPSAGIDSTIFNGDHCHLKEAQSFVIGYVSRVDKEKGWDTALYAFSKILNKIPEAKLIMIGSGKENEEAVKLIEELKLEKDVEKIEMLDQQRLAYYYSSFDVFLFPSVRAGESLGLVGLEAMACGTPVIGSDCGGIKTYVKHGINGFLFTPKNVESLAQSILEFYELSENQKKEMSAHALSTARDYDAQKVNNQLIDKINFVLEEIK